MMVFVRISNTKKMRKKKSWLGFPLLPALFVPIVLDCRAVGCGCALGPFRRRTGWWGVYWQPLPVATRRGHRQTLRYIFPAANFFLAIESTVRHATQVVAPVVLVPQLPFCIKTQSNMFTGVSSCPDLFATPQNDRFILPNLHFARRWGGCNTPGVNSL